MVKNPVAELRNALSALIDRAAFEYDAGDTRALIRNAQAALRETVPAVAHEKSAGFFKYDPEARGFVQVDDEQALDSRGKLKAGYQLLFKQHPDLVPH